MVYLNAFLEKDYPDPDSLFQKAFFCKPEDAVIGYGHIYRSVHYGCVECIAESNLKGEVTDLSSRIDGSYHYRMRVEGQLQKSDNDMVLMCATTVGVPLNIPVFIIRPHVLPSYLPGDAIEFQGVGYLVNFIICDDIARAEEKLGSLLS